MLGTPPRCPPIRVCRVAFGQFMPLTINQLAAPVRSVLAAPLRLRG
jgi:hypothetical protein